MGGVWREGGRGTGLATCLRVPSSGPMDIEDSPTHPPQEGQDLLGPRREPTAA